MNTKYQLPFSGPTPGKGKSLFVALAYLVGIFCSQQVCPADREPLPKLVLNSPVDEPLSTQNQRGMLDKLTTEIFKRCGYQLVIEKLPAERALRNANNAIIDGDLSRIAGLEKTYKNLVKVPEAVYDIKFTAFSSQNIDLTGKWNSLANKRVAYITGWKIFENKTPRSAAVTATKNSRQLFTLLQRNRTDVVLYYSLGGNYLIKQMSLREVKELSPILAETEMFIYLNQKHASLVPKLAMALAEMKADGSYKKLFSMDSVVNSVR